MKHTWAKTADVFDEAKTWKYRCLRAAMGTTTGALLMAVLGQQPKYGPVFGLTGNIKLDGTVTTAMRKSDSRWDYNVAIGSIEAVRDNFRLLADHCKLNDKDRVALFDELRLWIKKDERAQAGLTDHVK